MNRILFFSTILLLSFITHDANLYAQNGKRAKPGMGEGKFNYTSFTESVQDKSAETIAGNVGCETDPELGLLYRESPCKDCYETIGKRTETTKTYIRKGTNGTESLTQTSNAPMHYKDAAGRWRTIKSWLKPDNKAGIYAANEQPAPISTNTEKGYSSLGESGQNIQFNNQLELLYEKPDGTIVPIGNASWKKYTAGDDGIYVTDAWPGIDIEMRTMRGAVKTNFWINRALPEYANGKLLVRDHLKMEDGLSLFANGQKKYTGILEIRNSSNEKVYVISTATAFEKNDGVKTLRNLEYTIGDDNTLDIALPGDFLNRQASSYPVIIDPLVSLGTSVAVPGSTYSPGWTVGCPILNPATVPADLTITDIQFSFEFLASGGALQTDGALDFYLGACRNPALTGWYWYCLVFTPGLCGGANISLLSDFIPCVPPVNCASYNLNVTMNFYQSYLAAAPCSNLYITATQPLIITVVGQTLAASAATPSPATICIGQSATLSGSAVYGSAPYTYTWYPGPLIGSSVSVSPVTTTTYSLVVTDACGFSDTTTSTVTVNPNAPITGTTTFCIGATSALANAVGGGSWSSSNTTIATIDPASGVATGVASGTATISYTTPAGCLSTILVTVVSTTSPITGVLAVCEGATTSLFNSTPGGTWSSSSTSTATIDAATGVVTGVAAGTTTITYSISSGCYTTAPLPVFPTPIISSTASIDPTTCISLDGSITLNSLTPGATYTVNYLFNSTPVTVTITANATGQVIIIGLDGGSYTNISVTSSLGCISNIVTGPIALNFPPSPATPVVTNNGPFCAGNSLNLTAASSTPGITYSWTGPNGFTSTQQNPVINPAYTVNAGTYLVTATIIGCVSAPGTTTVIIHPIPNINNFTSANPTTCFGTDGTITLSGLLAGVSYSVNYSFNGNPLSATIVADAAGNVIITGLSAGVYTAINLSSFGCLSNTVEPLTLIDPGAPPAPTISTNSPVCEGTILALNAYNTTSGLLYSWTGPNGFTSSLQSTTITNVPIANAGTYTVVASNGPCSAYATTDVMIYPALTLTGVTPDQSIIFGTTIQLTASGALYYAWSPDDGTLTDPNIRNPKAHPIDKTTYLVVGMNEWGCTDSARVVIDIVYTDTVLIPTAFSPNGDGHNDVFRIANAKDAKLVAFEVFNRWGQVVYHNDYNIRQGWDGTFNGEPMDMGVYNYIIILAKSNGDNVTYKGTITLIK